MILSGVNNSVIFFQIVFLETSNWLYCYYYYFEGFFIWK